MLPLKQQLLTWCFLSLIFNLNSASAEEKIRYGISHWPPYGLTEQKQVSGINIDVGNELSRRVGIEFKVRVCPFKRCLFEMESGSLDLMSGIAKNPEREKYMSYTDPPYSAVSVVFYVRKGEGNSLKKYDDLYNLRVGYVSKSHYFEPFNSDSAIAKVDVDRERRLLPMLHSYRIDTYVGTDPNASYEVLTMGYKEKLEKALYNPNIEVPVYFATSRKFKFADLAGLIEKLGRKIQEMHDDGTMQKIHDKYQ